MYVDIVSSSPFFCLSCSVYIYAFIVNLSFVTTELHLPFDVLLNEKKQLTTFSLIFSLCLFYSVYHHKNSPLLISTSCSFLEFMKMLCAIYYIHHNKKSSYKTSVQQVKYCIDISKNQNIKCKPIESWMTIIISDH